MILSSLIAFLNELDRLGREMGWVKQVSVDDATRTITVRFWENWDNVSPRDATGWVCATYDSVFNNLLPELYARTAFESMLRERQRKGVANENLH